MARARKAPDGAILSAFWRVPDRHFAAGVCPFYDSAVATVSSVQPAVWTEPCLMPGRATPGAPALVLLPGPTDSWRSYQPVLDRLPPSMHTVAVSLRGHGDSDKPKTGYWVADYTVDVVHPLDALRIESAVLAGHWAHVSWPGGSLLITRSESPASCSKRPRRRFAATPDYRTSCSQSFRVWKIRSAQR